MNKYTVEPPTLDTLADFFALHPDPADVEKRLPVLRGNIEAGRVRLENILLLRSERGVEGTALVPAAPQVPVFPRFRPGVSRSAVTVLARALRGRAEPERVLVLQGDLAPLDATPVEAAGWVLDDEWVIYETDLRARPYHRDPQVIEGGSGWLALPEVRGLLETDGHEGYELGEGERLFGLNDGQGLAALGRMGPSGRPNWASLHLIGVLPRARGRGLGTRLHAHLLALAAEEYTHHGGSTAADNHAMRRIFEKSGSRLTATQMYFRPA